MGNASRAGKTSTSHRTHFSTIDPIVKQKLNSELYKSFIPCAIIYSPTKNDGKQAKEIIVKNQTYIQKWWMERLSVFVKK